MILYIHAVKMSVARCSGSANIGRSEDALRLESAAFRVAMRAAECKWMRTVATNQPDIQGNRFFSAQFFSAKVIVLFSASGLKQYQISAWHRNSTVVCNSTKETSARTSCCHLKADSGLATSRAFALLVLFD